MQRGINGNEGIEKLSGLAPTHGAQVPVRVLRDRHRPVAIDFESVLRDRTQWGQKIGCRNTHPPHVARLGRQDEIERDDLVGRPRQSNDIVHPIEEPRGVGGPVLLFDALRGADRPYRESGVLAPRATTTDSAENRGRRQQRARSRGELPA